MPKNGKTQKTKPAKGEPVDIPVPSREEVLRDLAKVAKAQPKKPKDRTTP